MNPEATFSNSVDGNPDIERAINDAFYLAQYQDVAAAGLKPAYHYLNAGAYEFRDPSALFSTFDYLADHPHLLRDRTNPLVHALKAGVTAWPRKPRRTKRLSIFLSEIGDRQDLFDPLFYALAHPGVDLRSARAHAQANPHSDAAVNPLFDGRYYQDQCGLEAPSITLLEHYLSEGWRKGLAPHRLFDVDWYARQTGELNIAPLLHYVRQGWRLGLTPHAAFEPGHYRKQSGIGDRVSPLVHYLLIAAPDAQPNHLFDDARIRSAMRALQISPNLACATELETYLSNSELWEQSTHTFFNAHRYFENKANVNRSGSGQRDHGKASAPLKDYLSTPETDRVSPSPYFWPSYYAAQTERVGLGARSLQHYLSDGGFRTFAPHPCIDIEHYSRVSPSFDRKTQSVVEHLLDMPAAERRSPTPMFDPAFYIRTYPDVAEAGVCPITHFCEQGILENRLPNGWYSPAYAFRRSVNRQFGLGPLADWFCAQSLEPRPALLFTSHDASRTGAPKIALRLMQDFEALGMFDIYCLLDQPGDLLADFQATSFAYVLDKSVYVHGANSPIHRAELKPLFEVLKGRVAGAICNSIETRHLAEYIFEQGIPIISLVHEMPDYYDATDFARAIDISREVVFPSRFVFDRATARFSLLPGSLNVIGQGLLDPAFGRQSRAAARRLAGSEFGIEPNATIVAGCGTVDLRKGMDYFVAIAREVLERGNDDGGAPVYFLWFGKADERPATPFGFLREELARLGLDDRIRFVGERENMAPYLAMADLFLLTSRADPFPCVAHEALASGLPVVCFREGGGAAELAGAEGVAVPLGDVSRAASAVLALIDDPERRARMGRKAAQRMATDWTSRAYAAQIADLGAKSFGGHGASMATAAARLREPLASQLSGRCPVYFLAPDWSISGVNSLTVSLIRRLRDLGWDAKILFTRGRFTRFERSQRNEVETPSMPFEVIYPQANDAESIWRALSVFLENSPEAIVAPNYDYVASALCPAFPNHIRVVGVAHSDHAEHYEHVYRLGSYWDRIVAVSDHVRQRIIAMNPAFRDRTTVIRNGVEIPPRHLPATNPGDRSTQPLRLAYAGRMVREQKQVRRYIALAGELLSRSIPFELLMIGDGEELPWLHRAVQGMPCVTLTGRLSQEATVDALAASDLFVLLSDYEGLPISLLEALSVGCAPVTFPIESGVSEVIQSGQNGFVSGSRSIAEVADIVERVHRDRGLLSRIRAAAAATIIEQGLSAAAAAASYSALFEAVLAEHVEHPDSRPPSLAWGNTFGALPPPAMAALF